MLLATTTVAIERHGGHGDPYEPEMDVRRASGVAAHIGSPSGRDVAVGGDQEVIEAVAYLPRGTCLGHADRLHDEGTGVWFDVVWVRARQGLGLDHVVAGLRTVKGGASG